MDNLLRSQDDIPVRVLHVIVGSETQVCIDLADVERVFPLVAVQEIPGGPDYLVGLISLHGTSIPIIDLALKLGLADPKNYDIDTPIVLCRTGGLIGGLVVSEVIEVAQPMVSDVQMVAEFAHSRPPLCGTVTIQQGLSLLIDTLRVLTLDLGESEAQQDQAFTYSESIENSAVPENMENSAVGGA